MTNAEFRKWLYYVETFHKGDVSGCVRCGGSGKEKVKDRVWDGDELPEPRVMRICPNCKGSGRSETLVKDWLEEDCLCKYMLEHGYYA